MREHIIRLVRLGVSTIRPPMVFLAAVFAFSDQIGTVKPIKKMFVVCLWMARRELISFYHNLMHETVMGRSRILARL